MEKRYSFAQTITDIHMPKMNLRQTYAFMKINSKQIVNLNEKLKTNICEEN